MVVIGHSIKIERHVTGDGFDLVTSRVPVQGQGDVLRVGVVEQAVKERIAGRGRDGYPVIEFGFRVRVVGLGQRQVMVRHELWLGMVTAGDIIRAELAFQGCGEIRSDVPLHGAAHQVLFALVRIGHAGEGVFHIPVHVIIFAGETNADIIADRAGYDRGKLLAVVFRVPVRGNAVFPFLGRAPGFYIERAGDDVLAEQHGLRALQHFHPLHVEEGIAERAAATEVGAVYEHADRLFKTVVLTRTHAADKDIGCRLGFGHHDRRHAQRQFIKTVYGRVIQHHAVHNRYGYRHVL